MKLFGLIGYPLSHSFSTAFFTEKFKGLGLLNYDYKPFPLKDFSREFPLLLKTYPNLCGLNVTIPYKEEVISFLNDLSHDAEIIGAVNCIKIVKGNLYGFNTDAFGFENSLRPLLKNISKKMVLVLGTGGASKAVRYVCEKLGFNVLFVSRFRQKNVISYQDLDENLMGEINLIVNTTPLGMNPRINACPDIPYQFLGPDHILYDLVYNPEKTLFLQKGEANNCTVKNGFEMLTLQAEKSWDIWKN